MVFSLHTKRVRRNPPSGFDPNFGDGGSSGVNERLPIYVSTIRGESRTKQVGQ